MTKETGIVINSREEMRSTYDIIVKKLKEISGDKNTQTKTNGQFRFAESPNSASLNIHTTKNTKDLANMIGFLSMRKAAYEAGMKELTGGEKFEPFTWLGYPADEWVHDAKVRYHVLTKGAEIKKLKDAEGKLKQYFTEEDRMANDLKDIKSTFGLE